MSDKKVIAIDPKIFSFSNNTTRKTRDKTKDKTKDESKIQMKLSKPKKNESLKKRSILNMIRKHQESEYKNKFENTNKNEVQSFNSDFNNATNFFKNLEDNVTKKAINSNHNSTSTLKQHPSLMNPIPKMQQVQPNMINTALPETLQNGTSSINPSTSHISTIINPNILPVPKYGCMKNGNLPTYRSFMNQTRKAQPDIIGGKPDNLPISVKNKNAE